MLPVVSFSMKKYIAAAAAYIFSLICNNALIAVFTILFFKIKSVHLFLIGNVCTSHTVNYSVFPVVDLIYFIIKVLLLAYAVWAVLYKGRDTIINLLLLYLPLFDLAGGLVVLANVATGHYIPDPFYSDYFLYFLSGYLFHGRYFVVPLCIGLVGLFMVRRYVIKQRYSAKQIGIFVALLLLGIIVPLLFLQLKNNF